MNIQRPQLLLASLLAFLLIVSRAPVMPGQLFSEDEVNFAYAIGHMDTRISQPQPPGYPIFVLETRVLEALRFKRPEHNLQALLYLASAGSVALTVAVGNRLVGGMSGWWSALLLLAHPSFWFAGLTSAVRVHLAVVSLAVAGSCWRLIETGSRRWLYASTLALGIGSGIRPELGPLLLPLWIWAVFRGERSWPHRLAAGALLTGTVIAWFLWVALASGGVVPYIRNTWAYLTMHVAVAPTLTGPGQEDLATLARILVWVGALAPGLVLPLLLSWKRGEGLGLDLKKIFFFALWTLPMLLFAGFVHLADPGHALGIVPALCLAGGGLIDRGCRLWGKTSGWREAAAIGVLVVGLSYSLVSFDANALAAIPISGLIAGNLLPRREAVETDTARVWHLGLVLIAPSVCLSVAFFLQPRWHVTRSPETLVEHINAQAIATNIAYIENLVGPDHRAITLARDWIAERPANAAIVWIGSYAHWRKVAYYMQTVPVIVVQRANFWPNAPWIVEIARGGRTEIQTSGVEVLPVHAVAGSRLVWMVNFRSPMEAELISEWGAECNGEGVCRVDLPVEHGSRRIGQIEVVW